MLEKIQELKERIEKLKKRFEEAKYVVNLEELEAKLEELEKKMSSSEFWSDPDKVKSLTIERNRLTAEVSSIKALEEKLEEASLMVEMLEEEFDPSLLKD